MDESRAAHDLFLLMLNLAQWDDPERITSQFIDALNTFWSDVRFQFLTDADPGDESLVAVATRRQRFGGVAITRGRSALSEPSLALIHNAACLLALILENRHQAQHLADENIRLDIAVQASIADLLGVNAQLRAEIKQRLKAERQFSNFFDLSPDLMCIADLQGVLQRVNPAFCAALGFDQKELISRSFTDWVDPQDRAKTLAAAARLAKGKSLANFTNRYRTKQGGYRWLAWSSRPDPERGVVYSVARDITEEIKAQQERKILEEQLLQAQKMQAIGTLAGGIAHDFNNILSIVLGNAELAADFVQEGTPLRKHFDEIQTACLRAKEMVRQLLSFSRKSNHIRQPIELAPVVMEAVSLIRSSIPAGIEIRSRIAGEPCTILGNATEIHQVLLNLCVNAAQSLEAKQGVIEVVLSPVRLDRKGSERFLGLMPGSYVQLEVRDTGGGIPAHLLDRIFEPYFTTKAVGEGTGLGLSVVHGIVKSHQGAVKVESAPGKGTSVTILLPCCEEPGKRVEIQTDELPGGEERILLVDDEKALVRTVGESLERLGYQVELHDDPRVALRQFLLQPEAYDLVITDIAMPHIGGDQLLVEIKKLRPELPVILFTGFTEKMNRKKALSLGACSYLEKPIVQRELAAVVREALDYR